MRVVPRAPAGSKKDWVTVTVEIPPDLFDRFIETGERLGFQTRTDAGHRALEDWVESNAPRQERRGERRGTVAEDRRDPAA